MPHNLVYEFGPYRLDPSKRVLTRGGDTLSLTPKATDILIILVKNAGELVDKEELMREVWPDTFVEEANLTQNVFLLRQVLGDERVGAQYIETVTRRGYRFVAQVRTNESQSKPSKVQEFSPLPIVAVLPFVNCTRNEDLEYLVDGLTDNIINNLSRVSKLRVMSRSSVLRYGAGEVDPQTAGKELGASAVLVGKISARRSTVVVGVELVDVATGWQLWGRSFDSENKDLLEIQGAITREVLATLKLELTNAEEKRVTARYTDNAEAYQAYLEGRYHWSRYTKKGIEKAIKHFRHAIEIDPNYALAYAGIVDCYLRLATNYLPPEDHISRLPNELAGRSHERDRKIKLRFEWDWKGAEREVRRATELKTDYPSAHQWYAAYLFSRELFKKSTRKSSNQPHRQLSDHMQPTQFFSSTLTPDEEVLVLCTITREQIEVGNYDAGCLILQKWWTPGDWPKIQGLSSYSAADLLFTAGSLAGCLSSTGRIEKGQKNAEDLLSGSIGILEHLGAKRRSTEAKIELALSYYRQGMFALTRKTLLRVLTELQDEDHELKSLALIRLGVLERHAGHVADGLSRLSQAQFAVEESGPFVTGRYYHELAITLRDIAIAENRTDYFDSVTAYFQRAFYEFVAVGHHRYTAVAENNHGIFLLALGRFDQAEVHLVHARRLLEGFDDKIRTAQVEDTLARLYVVTQRLDLADFSSESAVTCLETCDEEALLAEALTTRGLVLSKLNRHNSARQVLEGARRIAERCGDSEGAGRALLIVFEEMYDQLDQHELCYLAVRLRELLEHTQVASTRSRLENCLKQVSGSKNL
jgi:DNA-binding winged helix-turn-helix (wHTH) protein/tetratricopeptide (TPR) repeat protein